ncbi:MAG: ATP-binding protein [Mycobacteriales bacterium]
MSSEPEPGALQPAQELRLPSVAQSVRLARQFVRDLLTAADHERWVDAAELALSEIVTNGVLHAHTELTVRVRLREDEVEVEVQDGSPTLPVQRRTHQAEATTGRGLELVSALTRNCGVRPGPAGKVVWFTVGDDEPADETSEQDLLIAWDLEGVWIPEPASATGQAPAVQEVELRGMPTALWTAAREHHQTLLRELILYLAEHDDAASPRLDMALVDQARHTIWNELLAHREHSTGTAGRSLPDGRTGPLPEVLPPVDLRMSLPVGCSTAYSAMQEALDLGERLAVAGLLLARPGLPEIVAVRNWALDQIVAQLGGASVTPWPGTAQPRFTDLVHDRADPEPPDWDASQVTGSPRGVVAADDANRIIAISESLARTAGWSPQDLVGRRLVALVPPRLREAHVAGFSRHLSTGESHILGIDLELPVLHRNGSEVSCRFLIEQAEVGRGRPVYLAWIEPLDG